MTTINDPSTTAVLIGHTNDPDPVPVYWDPSRDGHISVEGELAAGRSTTATKIAAAFLSGQPNPRVIVFTQSRTPYVPFLVHDPRVTLATTRRQTDDAIQAIQAELDSRYEHIDRTLAHPADRILVIVDGDRAPNPSFFKNILRIGRSAGIHLLRVHHHDPDFAYGEARYNFGTNVHLRDTTETAKLLYDEQLATAVAELPHGKAIVVPAPGPEKPCTIINPEEI